MPWIKLDDGTPARGYGLTVVTNRSGRSEPIGTVLWNTDGQYKGFMATVDEPSKKNLVIVRVDLDEAVKGLRRAVSAIAAWNTRRTNKKLRDS